MSLKPPMKLSVICAAPAPMPSMTSAVAGIDSKPFSSVTVTVTRAKPSPHSHHCSPPTLKTHLPAHAPVLSPLQPPPQNIPKPQLHHPGVQPSQPKPVSSQTKLPLRVSSI